MSSVVEALQNLSKKMSLQLPHIKYVYCCAHAWLEGMNIVAHKYSYWHYFCMPNPSYNLPAYLQQQPYAFPTIAFHYLFVTLCCQQITSPSPASSLPLVERSGCCRINDLDTLSPAFPRLSWKASHWCRFPGLPFCIPVHRRHWVSQHHIVAIKRPWSDVWKVRE